MLQLKLDNSGVNPQDTLNRLDEYTAHIKQVRESKNYDQPECSINLPNDEELLNEVNNLAQQKAGTNLKAIVVIGIGGSNLGTKAVYDAVHGFFDILESQRYPKVMFAETSDPEYLNKITTALNNLQAPDEVLVTVISKSGGTTETLANFEIIMHGLKQKFENAESRVVAITDDNSKFMEAAKVKNIPCLPMPELVGGRYSVLSTVGLFPLLCAGVDIESLRKGASEVLDYCLNQDNIAAKSAIVLSANKDMGYPINDNFFFHPELESTGKWYRQLMGESIGKEHSLDGQVVNTGITPTVSLGSTDLHSVGQLYLGGPKDKFTTFVSVQNASDLNVPEDRIFPDLVPMITNKSAKTIMDAILEGVKISYKNATLPFMEVVLDNLDTESIGQYLQFKMLEMMYLGKLLNVNSFDQPNVESYKIETKKLLEA